MPYRPSGRTRRLAAVVGSLLSVGCGTPAERSNDRASAADTTAPAATDTAPTTPPPPARVDLRPLIGTRASARGELPPGLAPMAAWVVLPPPDQPIEFRIIDATYQGRGVLLLERVHQRDSSGQVTWEVTDALQLPAIPAGYALVRGGCSLTGKADGSIAALARSDVPQGGEYHAVMRAWRADLARRRFAELPVAGLRCVNQPVGER